MHKAELMTPRYRLAKVIWEAKNLKTSWQEVVDAAAKEKTGSATDLVSESLKLARAIISDGWHL